ncbi:hypothetical protein IFR09_01950 [Pseudomonas syringae]|nr:hypothetical protein [Pseudomonas syringae]MBD8790402.1 hypothetical protein [Pseudomonas syringae]MBD8799100.1 hypothetical protein [Pseudomonas syringae]MBD8809926.1 hypothetical protein [Pseudomonas syringae]
MCRTGLAPTHLWAQSHKVRNGRSLSPDPINLAGGLNTYPYVPDPTAWVDPLGLANVPGGCPGGKSGPAAGRA